MLQQPKPEDFVLATGETHPVREFVERSFALLGTTIQFVPFSSSLSAVSLNYDSQVARRGRRGRGC